MSSNHNNESIQAPALQEQLQTLSTPHAPLVVDIRSRRQFHRHRIPGSQHLPAGRLISTEFPERDLVLIGDDDFETRRLVGQLYEHGYPRRIQHLQGGLKAWSAAGLPLHSGADGTLKNRDLPIPWLTMTSIALLLIGFQQLSPPLLLLSLGLLLTPAMVSAWLQRNLFRLQRRAF